MNKKFLNIALFAVYDFISTLISVVLTFLVLSINPEIKLPWVWNSNLFYLCVSPFLVVFFLYVFKIYNVLWNFSGFFEAFKILISLFAGFAATSVICVAIFGSSYFHLTALIISYFLAVVFLLQIFLVWVYPKHHLIFQFFQ